MKCPYCGDPDNRVVASREARDDSEIRRRRECGECGRRFTTYEKTHDGFKLTVIKKDQSRVPYERDKVLAGLDKACYKRPVPAAHIQRIADKTEEYIFRRFDKEVSSAVIGEQVMRYLSMQHGFPLHRMNVISYGEYKPVTDNKGSEARAQNRRVSLVVLE